MIYWKILLGGIIIGVVIITIMIHGKEWGTFRPHPKVKTLESIKHNITPPIIKDQTKKKDK